MGVQEKMSACHQNGAVDTLRTMYTQRKSNVNAAINFWDKTKDQGVDQSDIFDLTGQQIKCQENHWQSSAET